MRSLTVTTLLVALSMVVAAQEPQPSPLSAIHARRWVYSDGPATSFEIRHNVYLTIEDGSASTPREILLVEECCFAWQPRRYLERGSRRLARLLEQIVPVRARGVLLQHVEHPGDCDDGYTDQYEQVTIDYSVLRCVEPKGLTYTLVRIKAVNAPGAK